MQCKWVLVVIFVIFLRLFISAQHFALYVTFLKCYQQLILLGNYCILRFAVSQTVLIFQHIFQLQIFHILEIIFFFQKALSSNTNSISNSLGPDLSLWGLIWVQTVYEAYQIEQKSKILAHSDSLYSVF